MTGPDLRRVFSMFDQNDEGKINRKELSDSLQRLGIPIPEKELQQMIENIDAKGDEFVDVNEFGTMYATIMEGSERGGDREDLGGVRSKKIWVISESELLVAFR